MRADLVRRLEMAVRVRDFFRTHQAAGATQEGAVTRLEQLVQRAQVLATQQREGVVATRSAAEHRAEVRKALQTKFLRYLAAVGAVAARDNTELGAAFRIPRPRGGNQVFLTWARAMLDKAIAQKDVLIKGGMSAQLLDDLGVALTEFEQTLEATRAARLGRVGATGDLEVALSDISQQVRVLDGLVRYRFGNDQEAMSAWTSARNVVGPAHSQKPDAGGNQAGGNTPAAA